MANIVDNLKRIKEEISDITNSDEIKNGREDRLDQRTYPLLEAIACIEESIEEIIYGD